jgi:hypothetical protein
MKTNALHTIIKDELSQKETSKTLSEINTMNSRSFKYIKNEVTLYLGFQSTLNTRSLTVVIENWKKGSAFTLQLLNTRLSIKSHLKFSLIMQ